MGDPGARATTDMGQGRRRGSNRPQGKGGVGWGMGRSALGSESQQLQEEGAGAGRGLGSCWTGAACQRPAQQGGKPGTDWGSREHSARQAGAGWRREHRQGSFCKGQIMAGGL